MNHERSNPSGPSDSDGWVELGLCSNCTGLAKLIGLLQITVGRNIEQLGSIRKAIVVINCSVVMNSKTEQINHSLAGTTRRTGLFSGYVHIIITSTLVTYF